MASSFHPALLLPRGIRPTNTMIVSPESEPTSPKRKSKSSVRKRLSSVSKLKKKKRSSLMNDESLPEQAPMSPLVLRPKLKLIETSPVLKWTERECPQDVIPKILAFCGPQTTATLYQCNRFWHGLISSDNTWRVLCEELYKVS